MSDFGVTTESRPKRVDELIDSELMAKLDQVDVMSRKLFAGKLQGERRRKRRGVSCASAACCHYSHDYDPPAVHGTIYRAPATPLRRAADARGMSEAGRRGWGISRTNASG